MTRCSMRSAIQKHLWDLVAGIFKGGFYYYEKKFLAPEEWRKETVQLHFEGSYQNNKVYLNGKEIGGCVYGYSGFTVTLDEALKYGEENILLVTVDNSKLPNTRWYSGSGIYRPVYLLRGGKSHIKWQGVKITTLNHAPAKIKVETSHIEGEVQIEILSDGECVARGNGDNTELTIPKCKIVE